MQPPIHEFWLKAHDEEFGLPEKENRNGWYRIALGDLIPASKKTTFPPVEGSRSFDLWNESGSIGFTDVTVRNERIPKIDAVPYVDHEYLSEHLEEARVLVLSVIGIEPQYRQLRYARLLYEQTERVAKEWGLHIIVADNIQNPRLPKILSERLGYTLYYRGMQAIKRL